MVEEFEIGHKINVQNENTQWEIENGFSWKYDLDVYAVICVFLVKIILP